MIVGEMIAAEPPDQIDAVGPEQVLLRLFRRDAAIWKQRTRQTENVGIGESKPEIRKMQAERRRLERRRAARIAAGLRVRPPRKHAPQPI